MNKYTILLLHYYCVNTVNTPRGLTQSIPSATPLATTSPSLPMTQPSLAITPPSLPMTQPSLAITPPSLPMTQPSLATTSPEIALPVINENEKKSLIESIYKELRNNQHANHHENLNNYIIALVNMDYNHKLIKMMQKAQTANALPQHQKELVLQKNKLDFWESILKVAKYFFNLKICSFIDESVQNSLSAYIQTSTGIPIIEYYFWHASICLTIFNTLYIVPEFLTSNEFSPIEESSKMLAYQINKFLRKYVVDPKKLKSSCIFREIFTVFSKYIFLLSDASKDQANNMFCGENKLNFLNKIEEFVEESFQKHYLFRGIEEDEMFFKASQISGCLSSTQSFFLHVFKEEEYRVHSHHLFDDNKKFDYIKRISH